MKNLFKSLIVIMLFIFSVNSSFAFSVGKLEKYLKKSNLQDTATIAISIRNADSNSIVYEQNQNKLLHPASTLKLFTTYVSMDSLGYDYFFKTQFYKDSANNLYIKLGADPLLTTAQLKQAFSELKKQGFTSFKNLYFDDSIIDKKEFPQGWMWDDDISPYTPKVSSYNLDGNILKVNLTKNSGDLLSAEVKSTFPISVISNVKLGSKYDYLEVNRYNWSNPDVVELYGNVTSARTLNLPISSMRRYYIHNVQKILEDNRINILGTKYASKLVPENAVLLTEISNPITAVVPSILQNSNNLMAESIYKLAAGKKYNSTGSDELASVMFKDFYNKNGIETDNIVIKDGCGVSRNNLFSVNWMSNALSKLYKMDNFEQFKDNMAQSGDGTLNNRLYDLRGEVWLKTGSLSNISTIAGYVKSQDGHTYSVVILTQNFLEEQPKIKEFENDIINIIYNR